MQIDEAIQKKQRQDQAVELMLLSVFCNSERLPRTAHGDVFVIPEYLKSSTSKFWWLAAIRLTKLELSHVALLIARFRSCGSFNKQLIKSEFLTTFI
jgi:hypothetical protein